MSPKIKNNILVIGATGFVGLALTSKLLKKKNNLFLVTRDKGFVCPEAKVFYGDLNNKNFCKKIVKDMDIVYYVAGHKKNVSVHTKNPFDAVLGNVLPLLNFLEEVKNSRVKKIIYLSSVVVQYASSKNLEMDGYVFGKHINELVLKSFSFQTGIRVSVVRPAAIYGPGNDFNQSTANIIPLLFLRTKENDNKILLRGDGKRKLQFVYIDDLVANLLAVARSSQEFFSIGNPEVISVKNLAQKISDITGKKFNVVVGKNKSDKPTKLTAFNNLIRPKTSLDCGLTKTWEYYKNNTQ